MSDSAVGDLQRTVAECPNRGGVPVAHLDVADMSGDIALSVSYASASRLVSR